MSAEAEKETMRWLERAVVGLNFCPFAKREISNQRVRMVALDSDKQGAEAWLQALVSECEILDNDQEVGTTLIIFERALREFEDYLDFVALAEDLLQSAGYEGTYQLASFHPDYQFAGCDADDATNYTNRSPYPMLHILREDEVSKALDSYPSPEAIPERNKQVCRELGIKALSALLRD